MARITEGISIFVAFDAAFVIEYQCDVCVRACLVSFCVPISMWCELLLFRRLFFNTPGNTWSCSWDTPFPLIHERFYIPDYLRVFEGIKATMEY